MATRLVRVQGLAFVAISIVATAVTVAQQSTADDDRAALGRIDAQGLTQSIWNGVYTEAQAKCGQAVYPGPCGVCHGRRLNGAPDDPDMLPTRPLAGAKFLRDWNGRSLAALFELTRTTMPANNPGFLSDDEYVDILAYMLFASGAPAGDTVLEPDPVSLARIAIEQIDGALNSDRRPRQPSPTR